jgi:predicted nucleic acid-binding protein
MGQIVLPASGSVYVDTNAVIFRVQLIEPHLTASDPLWKALRAITCQVVTSNLTLMKVLIKPIRDGDLALASLYRHVVLATVGLYCVPISLDILESAAELRAIHRLKTPDAIHAASAFAQGCTLFVTNDQDFKRIPNLNVAVLSEVAAS